MFPVSKRCSLVIQNRLVLMAEACANRRAFKRYIARLGVLQLRHGNLLSHLLHCNHAKPHARAQGRPLKAGDLLPLTPAAAKSQVGNACPKVWIPAYPTGAQAWEIGVLPGPNAAPDYFTQEDIETLYSATYTVHYNS